MTMIANTLLQCRRLRTARREKALVRKLGGDWLKQSGSRMILEQEARLTDRSVADIVKAHARRAGLDPKLFAGHSLRSGFLTSAAARGASIFKMADQSRHKSMDTLRGYVRDAGGCGREAGHQHQLR